MRSSTLAGRVFIVGVPRSGTTLLQSLMAAHPSVTSFPETHFFPLLAPRPWWRPLPVVPAQIRESWPEVARVVTEGSSVEPPPPPTGLSKRRWVHWFSRMLDQVARSKSARVWVEKTPNHLSFISMIRRYLPDARFVHLIRDGRSTVASLRDVTRRHPDQWGGVWSVERCVGLWNRAMKHHRRWIGRRGHVMVRYETLAEHPDTVMEAVCETVGLSWDDEYTKNAGRAAAGLIENEAWKSRNRSGVDGVARSKFKTALTEQERLLAEQNLTEPPV